MLRAKLKVVGGKHHGKLIPLSTRRFLIGREQDCQLRPNSELVSRHHCVFTVDDFTVRLRDLGSTNGTLVNDERVHGEVVLKSGDRVHVGKLDFEIEIPELAAVESSQPPPETVDLPDLPVTAETAQISATDESTIFDMPVQPSLDDSGSGMEQVDGGTTIISNQPLVPEQPAEEMLAPPQEVQQPVAPVPAMPPQMDPYQQPPAPMPQQPFAGYPQMPAYPPQQPMPYPQPGMPYAQPPMYQQPAMYPPQQMPVYPAQPAVAPQPAPIEQEIPDLDGSSDVPTPPVQLPDPETTGAKEPSPPSNAGKTGEGKPATPEVNPSNQAADILKQYTQRRPDV